MPRQTTAEIDAEIVDRAAALFSRRGFGDTSLQSVADAVGYTKAGLLHHFPSKQAIYDAVVSAVCDQLAALLVLVSDVPAGIERDRAVIERVVDLTVAWPGVSAFANNLVATEQVMDPELERAGLALAQAFAVDLEALDFGRLIRVSGACTALTATVLQAVQLGLASEWREPIIHMAMNTLGHSADEAN